MHRRRFIVVSVLAFTLPACGSSGSSADPADTGLGDAGPTDSAPADASPCEASVPPSAPSNAVTDVAFELAAPTGPHKVGTTLLRFVDASRPETVTADPSDFREVVVQLFYPTDADGPPAPLLSTAEAKVVFPVKFADFLKVKTHSTFDVPLAAGTFPLVVYAHGLGSFRSDNRALVESIASHGIVVAALSHTYYDSGTTLGSGAITKGEGLAGDLDLHALTKLWRDDARFAVSQLEALAAPAPCTFLSSRVDFSRMAMIGWSFGGATALHYCAGEPRCVGGINFDGTFFGTLDEPLDHPFMFLSERDAEPPWEILRAKSTSTTYTAWIEGTAHVNFSGVPGMRAGLGFASTAGPIDPVRAELLVGRYVQAFLDQHLLHASAPLLAVPSGVPADAPEVVLEIAKAGVVDGPPRILVQPLDLLSGAPVADLKLFVDGVLRTADPSGAFSFDTSLGMSPVLTATASGYMPSATRVVATPRYRSVDLPMAGTGDLVLAVGAASVTLQSGKAHVLVIAENCGAGLTATADAATTVYFDATTRYGDATLTSTSSLGTAAIVNAAPGPLAVTLHHAKYDVTTPFTATTGAGPVTIDVTADTTTALYVVCLPH